MQAGEQHGEAGVNRGAEFISLLLPYEAVAVKDQLEREFHHTAAGVWNLYFEM